MTLAAGRSHEAGRDQIIGRIARGIGRVGRPEVLGREAEMPLARYLALPHVLVSPNGDLTGVADMALTAMGQALRVVATVPQFFPALAAVAETGCIATLPDRLARRYGPPRGLSVAAPPLALRSFEISALRRRRNEADPRLLWLLDLVRAAAADP